MLRLPEEPIELPGTKRQCNSHPLWAQRMEILYSSKVPRESYKYGRFEQHRTSKIIPDTEKNTPVILTTT